MYKLLLCLAIAAVLVSCSKNNSSAPSATYIGASGLMPLGVGYQWDYAKKFYDSAKGTVTSTTNDTIAIIQETDIGDTAYFQQVQTSKLETWASFYVNTDSNTLVKIDSATRYVFFKRVSSNGPISSWADTISTRCKGVNTLYAYTGDTTIGSYTGCLKNTVTITDCTGQAFQQYVYYLQPGTGYVRIEHYLIKNDNVTWYVDFTEDLTTFIKG